MFRGVSQENFPGRKEKCKDGRIVLPKYCST